MYDDFSSDYDRFVNWSGRLAFEMPMLEAQLSVLSEKEPVRVLDAACGTGMHALALARRGFIAAGADLSAGMIARARANAEQAGLDVPFLVAGFGELASAFSAQPPFDALLCLGNSLPHLLSRAALEQSLLDFGNCLRPGGMLLLQNRNFDAVMAAKERWMEPQTHQEGETERIFLRFYDYEPDGNIQFNIVTLRRAASGWEPQVVSTRLRPLLQAELEETLQKVGFEQIESFGGLDGSRFEMQKSPNLVVRAIWKG